ncbi:hypothetical protein CLIB1444_21S00364 [[Candida] jaroonii]|uniref:Uncharacterized protein n=1 Tax=[Candida] jaroonii TaxID=467808 RepID=A0ACA9YFF8_9ASCO|nr:hypothetical protein CLIB1444_21S00364 [[Candida] jaroonii]
MLFIIYLVTLAIATPPACFLSCINEVAKSCEYNHRDLTCLCQKKDEIFGCLVDICPYGNFESARDHYLGTCLEHHHPHTPQESTTSTVGSATEDCDEPTKTSTIVVPRPTISTIPSPNPEDCDKDHDHFDCDEKDDGEYDSCEWEEEEHTDKDGYVIIIRKPINVPQKYLSPPYTNPKRRKVIIKHPKSDKTTVKSASFKDISMNKLKGLKTSMGEIKETMSKSKQDKMEKVTENLEKINEKSISLKSGQSTKMGNMKKSMEKKVSEFQGYN